MTRKQLIFKTLAICAILLAGIIFPTILTAQRSDGFFKTDNDDAYNNRDESPYNIGIDPFGAAPLGSGLLVLTLAGAGYAVVRRKRSLRKGATLLLACTLILGTTQCKKRIETIKYNPENTIQITLRTGYDDAKHYISLDQQLGYSPVHFSSGDEIYVGDGTSYLGKLTYGNDGFTGIIDSPSSSASYLYFYFVGNRTPTWNATNSAFTIDISDQKNVNVGVYNLTEKLPVLACGRDDYYPGKDAFDCTLKNQCVLVRFEIDETEGITDTYRISNMLSEARVDFTSDSEPEIVPTGVLDAITLYCGPHYQINNNSNQNELQLNYKYRWAVLLKTPEARHTYAIKGDDEADNRTYYDMDNMGPFTPGLPADNYIYNLYTIHNTANNVTEDALFVVSTNGNVVQFSPGNLQYKPSSGEWRFAERQWDYVGGFKKNGKTYGTLGTDNSNEYIATGGYQGWIDLFGWGCTGISLGQTYYQPTSCGYSNQPTSEVNFQYGPPGICNLTVSNSSDWGAVVNNNGNEWRTMTYNEWYGLSNFYKMNTDLYGSARISNDGGVNVLSQGIIILPVNYKGDYEVKHSTSGSDNFANNTFNETDWNALETEGALFLPFAYLRCGTIMSNSSYYWASSTQSANQASYVSITASNKVNVSTGTYRSYGNAVRLVRDAN